MRLSSSKYGCLMARNKNVFGETRPIEAAEAIEILFTNIENLRSLCDSFDQGKVSFSGLIALQVHKILCEGMATKIRRKITFPTSRWDSPENNMMPYAPLIGLELAGNPLCAKFLPKFMMGDDKSDLLKNDILPFQEWWTSDVIYRAGPAKPGSDPRMIPLKIEDQVPYRKRKKITRLNLITMVRQKLGAHTENEYPILMDELNSSAYMGIDAESVEQDGSLKSISNGQIKVIMSPLEGSVRQIAEETLVGFDSADVVALNAWSISRRANRN